MPPAFPQGRQSVLDTHTPFTHTLIRHVFASEMTCKTVFSSEKFPFEVEAFL